jgi:hypothetical protein
MICLHHRPPGSPHVQTQTGPVVLVPNLARFTIFRAVRRDPVKAARIVQTMRIEAFRAFATDVAKGSYPTAAHQITMTAEADESLLRLIQAK